MEKNLALYLAHHKCARNSGHGDDGDDDDDSNDLYCFVIMQYEEI